MKRSRSVAQLILQTTIEELGGKTKQEFFTGVQIYVKD